ncbi:TauD/TfdA family dioxygenase [Pseudofrankia sp. BMG5.36]|uniref:TauD/TfdA dioxygenase family protein n=1 Tax=Pseudofrankia sp. BMG5.36 TaxID=1834512 RepID=UPI0012FF7C1C|nr:TauD/TfdA family dioxygenase [Pseudofrankia sp. BMG5.36]
MTAAWQVTPLAGRVGVAVRGLDLRAADDTAVEGLQSLLADHGVVVIPDQHVTPTDHIRIGEALGRIKQPPDYIETLPGFDQLAVISTENGLGYATDRWHSDVTWAAAPPKYSILHMEQPPPSGGDTMWSSQFEAFDWLSPSLQSLLIGLTAEHALPTGDAKFSSRHPVVISHPRTGRKALFVNSIFTKRIIELREDESDGLLAYLFAHSTRPELVCRWTWSKGDLAIWDNQFVQHYAVGDYHPAPRKIHRIEIEGEPPVPATI